MRMKRVWFDIFLILIIIFLGGLLVWALFQLQNIPKPVVPEPIVIERTVYPEPQILYRDRVFERIVEKPIVVEKVVEVAKEPRWFKSEEELKIWLSKYPMWGGLDCDDLQEMLMFDAFKDGFIITPIPVFYGKVFDEAVLNIGISGVLDFGAWTWISNDLFYVDLRLRLPHYKKIQTVWRD